MQTKQPHTIAILLLVMGLGMTSCGPGQPLEPTGTPIPSPTSAPSPTFTPPPIPTITPTFTITPSPTSDAGATATQEINALEQAALQVCHGKAIPEAAFYDPSTPPFPIAYVWGEQNIQTDTNVPLAYRDRDLSKWSPKNIHDLQLVLCYSDEQITPAIVEQCPYIGADPNKIIFVSRIITYEKYNIFVAKTAQIASWITDPSLQPDKCPPKISVSQRVISSGPDRDYLTNVLAAFLQFAKAAKKAPTPTPLPTAPLPTATLAVTDVGVNDIIAISVGGEHVCGLTSVGGVKCWGNNFHGQLGDGTQNNSSTPVDVSGLSSGVRAISAGGWYTCALTLSGGVKCWGDNSNGQLGDGTQNNSSTPVDVSGLTSGVSAISAGIDHTCAITSSGGVKCWGTNDGWQLGDGGHKNSSTPVDVRGLTSGIAGVSAGGWQTCALTSSGGIKCWGSNSSGQLGNNSTAIYSTIPVDVSGLTKGVDAIAVGDDFACALTSAGGVKCWVNNDKGQLGDGTHNNRSASVDVSGLISGVSAITTGNNFTCALTSSGGVKCWGDNFQGRLGLTAVENSPMPVDISGLTSDVTAISAGLNSICVLTSIGGVKCW
jgi:alpha-tubulin suppressor-like RCC1 family protein